MTRQAVYTASKMKDCRCGAVIVMRYNATTAKWSPWDPPVRCACSKDIPVSKDNPGCAACEHGFVWKSHYATCKQAGAFR